MRIEDVPTASKLKQEIERLQDLRKAVTNPDKVLLAFQRGNDFNTAKSVQVAKGGALDIAIRALALNQVDVELAEAEARLTAL